MSWTEIKAMVIQIGCNGTRDGFVFACLMFYLFPELKNA